VASSFPACRPSRLVVPGPEVRLAGCAADFPVLSRRIDGHPIVYLDNAATTLKPNTVIDGIANFYRENGANIHRGRHFLSEEASDLYESARSDVAQFLGAYPPEIVFVRNTTEALNLVASGSELEADDLVIAGLDSHHSQLLPWLRYARVKLIDVDSEGRVDLDHYRQLLRKRPRIVALTHCSNVTGAIAPIETMAAMAKEESDATVVIDAAQSAPHARLKVSTPAIDFLAFSGHKMLGPTGVGCLFGRREALERLKPPLLGGGVVDWVETHAYELRKIPHRFEAGTPAIASAIGLTHALAYLDRLGSDPRAEHDNGLAAALVTGALDRDYLDLIGPATARDRHAIVSLRVRGVDDLGDIARSLSDGYGIMCRTGHMCAQPLVNAFGPGEVLRAAAYVYNSAAEVASFYDALDSLVPFYT
jgi:cysteine desulfurase/selenocysteine lyase